MANAASMGAHAEKADDIADLDAEIADARSRAFPTVFVIKTSPAEDPGFVEVGLWWDVAVPEVGSRASVNAAQTGYLENMARQRLVN